MEVMKVSLVIALGLSLTWAVGVFTGTSPLDGTGPLLSATAQDGDSADMPAEEEASGPGRDVPSPVEELTQEEIDAELARIESVLEGDEEPLKEFIPTRPVPADMPLELPSDI